MNLLRTRRLTSLLAPALALAFTVCGSAAVSASAPPTSPPESETSSGEPTETTSVDTVPTELPEGFVWLVDDTGAITVAVPEAWTDVDTAPAVDVDGNPQPWIAAAPSSIDDFLATFDQPGVLYTVFAYDPDPRFLIDAYSISEGCSSFALEDFKSHEFTGLTNIGTGCGEDGNASWQLVAASPADQSFTALVQVQTLSEDDVEATQLALDSFTTTGVPMVTPGSSVPGPSEPAPSAPATTEAAG